MSDPESQVQIRRLRNLVCMAMADGQISEGEVNLIADHCAALGLTSEDLQRAIQFGLDDNAAVEIPTLTRDREELLIDLVQMMGADGRLEESEKRLFALAAAKMDISPGDLDRIIDRAIADQ